MSIEQASKWLTDMMSREAILIGDANAIRVVGRRCGLGYWPTYRLMRKEAKTLDVGVYAKIRTAYLGFCRREIAKLEHEFEVARVVDADLEDLEGEISALAAKVKAARA